jgi:hypothetical protein
VSLPYAKLFVDEFSAAYYANRGGAMVDLQGKVIGTCTPAPLQEFHCMIKVRSADGERKLDCKSDLTPADFTEPH